MHREMSAILTVHGDIILSSLWPMGEQEPYVSLCKVIHVGMFLENKKVGKEGVHSIFLGYITW